MYPSGCQTNRAPFSCASSSDDRLASTADASATPVPTITHDRDAHPETVRDGVRPTELIIVDAVDTHHVTRVTWSGFRAEDVQDEWFQREYLPRFSE